MYTAPAEKEEYSLYNVDNINKSSTQQQPVRVQVKMNGKDISMVVETEAGVSIINELTMQTVVTDNPTKLQPADHLTLTSYTGQTIPVLGLLNVMTEYPGADRGGSGRNAESARQKFADRVQVGLR